VVLVGSSYLSALDRDGFKNVVDVMGSHSKMLFVLPTGDSTAAVNLANALVVAPLDASGRLSATSSARSTSAQLAAPSYVTGVSGGSTDYAAPYAAHAAAWLLWRSPTLTVKDIMTDLRASVLPDPSLKGATSWGGYINFDSLREKFGG
jgi:hypothetical protein